MVGAGATALILVLFVQLNYLQVFHATSLDENKLDTAWRTGPVPTTPGGYYLRRR